MNFECKDFNLSDANKVFIEDKLKKFKLGVVRVEKEFDYFVITTMYCGDKIETKNKDFHVAIQLLKNILNVLNNKRLHKKRKAKRALQFGEKNFYKDALINDYNSENIED